MNLNLPFLRIPDALLEGLKTVVFARGLKLQMLHLLSFRNAVVASSSQHTIRGRARNQLSEHRWLERLVDVAVNVVAAVATCNKLAYCFDAWVHDIH
jgi:hypothetical protein